MNQINHHLTDALLMSYSAGTLPEGFSLVVATHISLCDECRARMMEFDSVGGAIIDDQEPVAMSSGSLAAVMAQIGAQSSQTKSSTPPIVTRAPVRTGIFPTPLQNYVGGDAEAVKWRRIGGGVRQAMLDVDKSTSVRLLYIPAGMAVPDHGHRGTELTLVLQGAFKDEVDHFSVGDIEVATEELEHQPIAEEGDDCICLAATDAPLRFNSLLPRMAQRFLRI